LLIVVLFYVCWKGLEPLCYVVSRFTVPKGVDGSPIEKLIHEEHEPEKRKYMGKSSFVLLSVLCG
jgi:hypothetical protein